MRSSSKRLLVAFALVALMEAPVGVATGDTLVFFTALANEPTSSNYATLDTRNQHVVLDFDQTTDESAVFRGVMPRSYAGGGVTVYLHISCSGVTANEARFDVSFERLGDGSQDIDSDGFASANSVDITCPGTDGFVEIGNVAFTDGAQMDSVAVGESFRLKVTRDANHANDDATADVELSAIEIKET